MNKINEALDMLKQFNVPNKQRNERSALTLLALLALKEKDSWGDAKKVFIRVYELMKFMENEYNKKYAPNSRETIRRQTLHQFEKEIGIVERNADEPTRPTNSPNTKWSVTDDVLNMVKTYGTSKWDKELSIFLKKIKRSVVSYKVKRRKNELSITLDNKEITFSPGKHNELQIDVINTFRKHFCPNAEVLYVGDTAHKMLYLNKILLQNINMKIKKHDILPDIIFFDEDKKILYLIEAVSSHGPVSNKRKIELDEYFFEYDYKRVFVSAFSGIREYKKHADDIAWETEVWFSESPNHMIHYNGDKFLKLN